MIIINIFLCFKVFIVYYYYVPGFRECQLKSFLKKKGSKALEIRYGGTGVSPLADSATPVPGPSAGPINRSLS